MSQTEWTWLGAMMALAELGIKEIRVEYSGGGDSGQIDAYHYNKTPELGEWENSFIKIDEDELPEGLHAFIDKRVDNLLVNGIEDWYNNDGGQGELRINVPEGVYTLENNIYHQESTTYNHEGTFTEEGYSLDTEIYAGEE